jgi:hypothetical protein
MPNLKYATQLTRLNYGFNQITTFPDLSNNLLLAELSLDHNQLKSIPSLHSFTLLTNLELQNNYLTYAELTKIASHPNYSSNFILFNQNTLINRDTLLYVGNAITFECPFDINTAGTSYQWKKNGVNINNATQNKYTIPKLAITDSANYTCEIKNTNLPNTSINGVNYYLRIIHCPLTSNIYVKQMKPITCEENGVLEVELKNLQNDSVLFILTNLYNNTATTNTNGHFDDLQHQSYQLQIKASPNCVVNYPSTIYVDKISDCKETYITPNGDGDRDTYEIEGTGTAFIYNKNGVLVNKLSLPQAWDGTDLSGKMVDVGLYFIRLNNEKKSLQISVLY